jgi:RND family efflux transporter MFP subunit
LPFPERVADSLVPGQSVRLRVNSGNQAVNATISELRPMIGTNSRAVEAIVELDNPGTWRPGNSVSATVVLSTRTGQALVPALSVVQRPAGSVVYVLDGDTARQRVVEIGVRTNGDVEVRDGLAEGERVVVDGAGFLTDGTRVEVQDAVR